jgi:hypothetical protein
LTSRGARELACFNRLSLCVWLSQREFGPVRETAVPPNCANETRARATRQMPHEFVSAGKPSLLDPCKTAELAEEFALPKRQQQPQRQIFNSWRAREDSNLQPDRYERDYFIGSIGKIWRFSTPQPTNVLVWFTSFIGEKLVGPPAGLSLRARSRMRATKTGASVRLDRIAAMRRQSAATVGWCKPDRADNAAKVFGRMRPSSAAFATIGLASRHVV